MFIERVEDLTKIACYRKSTQSTTKFLFRMLIWTSTSQRHWWCQLYLILCQPENHWLVKIKEFFCFVGTKSVGKLYCTRLTQEFYNLQSAWILHVTSLNTPRHVHLENYGVSIACSRLEYIQHFILWCDVLYARIFYSTKFSSWRYFSEPRRSEEKYKR